MSGLDKGLVIGAEYVVGVATGAPSFSELKSAGFDLIGTIAYSSWSPSYEWVKAQSWVQSAHAAGFTVLIDTLAHSGDQLAGMTQNAAKIGADIVALDEPISAFSTYVNQSILQSIIEAGRAVNPNLQFLINEYSPDYIREAYEWSAEYSFVRVATDNYNDKSVIDLGIQLSMQYHKETIVWLIFARGSQDFDCYEHLDDWILYVEQGEVSAIFWWIDPMNTWQAQWSKVVAFDPYAYS
jgi:hypothetical protein